MKRYKAEYIREVGQKIALMRKEHLGDGEIAVKLQEQGYRITGGRDFTEPVVGYIFKKYKEILFSADLTGQAAVQMTQPQDQPNLPMRMNKAATAIPVQYLKQVLRDQQMSDAQKLRIIAALIE